MIVLCKGSVALKNWFYGKRMDFIEKDFDKYGRIVSNRGRDGKKK